MLRIQARKCRFVSTASFSTFKNPSTTSQKPSSSSSSSSSFSSASLIKPITVHVGAGNHLHYPKLQSLHPNIPYPLKLVPTEGEEGVKLTVQVADSAFGDQQHLVDTNFDQTIVALHGTPGYLQHFDVLFAEYQKQTSGSRVRLIAPNLPDFSHTRSTGGLFWHTAEEKVAFLRDLLLNRLQVTTIDCLVAHSAGAQTALALATEHHQDPDPGPRLKIRSIALLSPQPMLDPVAPAVRAAARRLFRLASLAGKVGASEAFYRLLSVAQLHRLIRSAYRFATTDELLWALTTLVDLQTPLSVQRRVNEVVQKSSSLPVTLLYGSRETIISRRAQHQFLTEYFGVPAERFVFLDLSDDAKRGDGGGDGGGDDGGELGDLAKIQPGGDRIKAYYINGGSHFAFARHAQATVRMIDCLLKTAAQDTA
ncbi:hypothetical protein TYRP_011574 [Tyrophagus putrescentiae]|nr:hypothetical protein TYRP_011574 [Tyrophagus putrescentiae]